MKKKFIEPEIKRIELNLNENIASSDTRPELVTGGVRVTVEEEGCLESVHGTGIHVDEYLLTKENLFEVWDKKCFVDSPASVARRLGIPIPNDMY